MAHDTTTMVCVTLSVSTSSAAVPVAPPLPPTRLRFPGPTRTRFPVHGAERVTELKVSW